MSNKNYYPNRRQINTGNYVLCLLILVFFIISKATPAQATPICNSGSAICIFLTEKYSQGLASGNTGDYYHNADGQHSSLSGAATDHPQVTIMTPTYGFVSTVDQNKVIVGNASLAYTSLPGTISLPRYWIRSSNGANILYQQYINNNAFWYPEHRDHDETDDYHAMLPSVSNSQGSSGSEIDEVKKFFWTLAAFQPETKSKLIEKGLLMPTIQMIMRRTRVNSNTEYLSGQAHPNAFDNYDNAMAMVQMANEILPTEIPPMVQLQITEDTYTGIKGKNYFDYINNQQLYETPVSISRLWKNFNYTQKMRISAKNSYDTNERLLTYHWVILRGNPEHIRITPLDDKSTEVLIEIDYHHKTMIPNSTRNTNLVVIGAFVHNGIYYSAPGFITSYTLPNEERTYNTNPPHQLLTINYHDENIMEDIICNKYWTQDVFNYNVGGLLKGWTRYNGTSFSEFTPQGYLVIARNGEGQVTQAQEVQYSRDYTSTPDRIIWSAIGDVFECDNELPSAPTQIIFSNPTESSLSLSWNAATDNIEVIGYLLDISIDISFSNPVIGYQNKDIGNVTNILISGLSSGTKYYARLRAYDEMINLSEYSTICSNQTLSPLNPTPTPDDSISIPFNLDKVRVYPQPWKPDNYFNLPITFDQLTPGCTIKIFTVSGNLVNVLKSENNMVQWYLTNHNGHQVSTGIYIYTITNDKGKKIQGKLAIIR